MNVNHNTDPLVLGAFPKAAIEQANAAKHVRISSRLSRRLDLRGKTVFTFGETSSDAPEYAFSLYKTAYGWQLGVHAADVCEYVCDNSPLDLEARRRRATVKNGFVKSEMLPDSISKELCALVPNADKLCLSVLMDINNNGELVSMQFEESVVRVSAHCIFSEMDQFALARDASSVMALRDKYNPLIAPLTDMYELAAVLYNNRRENGGLDCTVFRRIYERDESGRVVSFRRESEPDSRAMIREIGYFASVTIGEYMYKNKLPCIFIGNESVPESALDYIEQLLQIDNSGKTLDERAAIVSDLAKGSQYYSFICEVLHQSLPCAEYSDSPKVNTLCMSDKVVSFVRPLSRYASLLTHRILKTNIAAGNNPKNLNITKYRRIVAETTVEANRAERFVYETEKRFYNIAALEYLEHSGVTTLLGFPLYRDESGSVPVLLECGVRAIIPSSEAEGYTFDAAKEAEFEIIALGTEFEPTIVKPII